jgi:hypothetical protein
MLTESYTETVDMILRKEESKTYMISGRAV